MKAHWALFLGRIAMLALATLAIAGCNSPKIGTTPPPPPPDGFNVDFTDITTQGVTIGHHSGGEVKGQVVNGIGTVQGTVTSFDLSSVTWPHNVAGGEAPAVWAGNVFDHCFTGGSTIWSSSPTTGIPLHSTFVVASCALGATNATFFLTSALPATLTVQAPGFTTAGGMPQLSVFSYSQGLVSSILATSVVPDGSSAIFNFPKNTNGSALPQGEYGYIVYNQTSPGAFQELSGNFFSIGSLDTSHAAPLGIDAGAVTTSGNECVKLITGLHSFEWECDPFGPDTTVTPLFTQLNAGTACFGACVPVGSQPTAIKGYRNASIFQTTRSLTGTSTSHGETTTQQFTRAIVTNFGSNTVSILGLSPAGNSVLNTLAVGGQPATVVIGPNESSAYVANYGSASISVVNLTTPAISAAITVGSNPSALAMDPSGTALWVGGNNYISKIDLGTLQSVANFTVNGQVTSLTISVGQNAFVYTTMGTSFTPAATANFSIQHASLSTGTFMATDFVYSAPISSFTQGSFQAQYFAAGSTTSSAPPAWLAAQGASVSADFGNRYMVTGTPTGFVVVDLQTNTTVLQSATASPIRGIATDAAQGIIYLTAPDSNSLYMVPLQSQN